MARVSFKKGDVVLFHTGWLSLVGEDNERFGKAQPGLGVDGAKYLAEQGVVAVGADNWDLRSFPSRTAPACSKFIKHCSQSMAFTSSKT